MGRPLSRRPRYPSLFEAAFGPGEITADISDSGLASVTGSVYDAGKFRSPTLRNIEHTAPYMHDGRFQTLREALDHYDGGLRSSPTLDPLLVGREARLTDEQKDAILAFLLTLSDPEFLMRP